MKRALLLVFCALMSVQIFSTVDIPAELFPTLAGLQRTSCSEYTDCQENKTYLMQFDEIKEINGKQYLKYGGLFLREENSKVLIYSFPYEKDLVLYDWTLEIGDSLQELGIDPYSFPELEYIAVVDYVAFEEYDENGNRTIVKEPLGKKRVKDISTMRLLDGNEYKAWLFGYDWERGDYYIEGIGNASKYGGDYVDLAHPFDVPTCYYGERLVCVSRDDVLLYQMDTDEMIRLGTECLCETEEPIGPTDDPNKGDLGGRPTPTQWNLLSYSTQNDELNQAETFIYKIGDNVQYVNNKKYLDLTRFSSKDSTAETTVIGALHFGYDGDVNFLYNKTEYLLYDFGAEVGDTLNLFSGIDNYTSDCQTYTHVVKKKEILEDGRTKMILDVILYEEIDGTIFERKWEKIWIAGLGSLDGIVHNSASLQSDNRGEVILCAYCNNECCYMTDLPLYEELGCIYNEDPTAVENIKISSSSAHKFVRDDQLLILRDGKTYNIMGIEITK